MKPFLDQYLEKTQDSTSENLFVSLYRPFNSLTTVSIRNIFVYAMQSAKIDTSLFGPHSARASASSSPGLTLKEILKMGCWKNESTFRRYYEANILE